MSNCSPNEFTDVVELVSGEWNGKDYYKSSFEKIKVIGIFNNLDADKDSLSILMHRSSRVLYRSGPANSN